MSRRLVIACPFLLIALVGCSGEIGQDGVSPGPNVPSPPTPTPNPTVPAPAAPAAARAMTGVLDCPTVALPAYGASAPPEVALSGTFKSLCGTCHGGWGEGQGASPPLPGLLDQAALVAVVRKGTKSMPSFGADVVSDADLSRDFRAMGQRSGAGKPGSAPGWPGGELESVYQGGLAAWRQPDAQGAACASCHSPDAVDLAVIGYPDASILRRALKHLPAPKALDLRDFVHAQRRRLGITAPCSPDWRPFQPGGTPLPGATVVDQELAFARHLEERGLRIAVGKIDSPQSAREARDQLLAIDLRKLRIGIPLPRWTEDAFHGPDHNTINDWIPGLPRIAKPGKESALRGLEDAYIANPSRDNLFELVNQLPSLTHDGGFAAGFKDRFGHGDNWLTNAMLTKKQSLLVGQHFLRMAVLGRAGWFELAPVPYPDVKEPFHFNPFFSLAQGSLGAPCANDARCGEHYITQFPQEILAEAPPKTANRPDQYSHRFISQLTHPWFTLGQIFDQGLLKSGGAGHNTTEAVYWNSLHFPHNLVHKLFFNTHRFLMQTQYRTDKGDTGLAPLVRAGNDAAPALLNGDWVHVSGISLPDPGDPRAGGHVRTMVNVQRMLLYLMRDRLLGGSTVSVKTNLLTTLRQWRGVLAGNDGLVARLGQSA